MATLTAAKRKTCTDILTRIKASILVYYEWSGFCLWWAVCHRDDLWNALRWCEPVSFDVILIELFVPVVTQQGSSPHCCIFTLYSKTDKNHTSSVDSCKTLKCFCHKCYLFILNMSIRYGITSSLKTQATTKKSNILCEIYCADSLKAVCSSRELTSDKQVFKPLMELFLSSRWPGVGVDHNSLNPFSECDFYIMLICTNGDLFIPEWSLDT